MYKGSAMKEYTKDLMLHVLRNPYGWDDKDIRKAALQAADEIEAGRGYKEAYYKIADALEIPAMPVSPKEAFETVMLPKVQALMQIRQGAAFREGDIILLKLNSKVGAEEFFAIHKAVEHAAELTNLKFVILPDSIDVVEKKSTGDLNA
jgi:hypothetical protein